MVAAMVGRQKELPTKSECDDEIRSMEYKTFLDPVRLIPRLKLEFDLCAV
jgi:hypothetical protein